MSALRRILHISIDYRIWCADNWGRAPFFRGECLLKVPGEDNRSRSQKGFQFPLEHLKLRLAGDEDFPEPDFVPQYNLLSENFDATADLLRDILSEEFLPVFPQPLIQMSHKVPFQ